ncbi:MAG: HEAT repeat domain-containing protein, partial [Chloroflexota bacterium]|nr:HEAT repeat domain-containing protein [Chloroflexota bacterium]
MGKSGSSSGSRPNIERMKAARDIEGLMNVAREHVDKVARRDSMLALGTLGDSLSLDAICEGLRDRDADVRKAAAWALGKMADERAVEPLVRALHDMDWSVRAAISKALGFMGESRAADALTLVALTDKKKMVRKSAQEALMKIEERLGVPREETDAILSQAEGILATSNETQGLESRIGSKEEKDKRYLALFENERCSCCKVFYSSPCICPYNRDLRGNCLSFEELDEELRREYLNNSFWRLVILEAMR